MNKLFDIGYCFANYSEHVDLDKISEVLTYLAQEIQTIGKVILLKDKSEEPPEEVEDES